MWTAGPRTWVSQPNGAGSRTGSSSMRSATSQISLKEDMKVFDPLFSLLVAREQRAVAVLNPTRDSQTLVSKWNQHDQFEQSGIPHAD